MNDTVYKIEAEGDTLYYAAATEDEAYTRISMLVGRIPRSMLTFTKMAREQVPNSEEVL